MKKYAIGVIGAGAIAQNCHIPGYATAENCALRSISDPEPKCLKMVRDSGWVFDSEYSDYREMLKQEKLDAISICTPNKFHSQIAVDCLNAGCDILLEKPIALSMQEAAEIKEAADRSGKRVMVGFSHRFNELNQAARSAISEGKIGEPYMIRIRFAHTGPWPGWAKTDWFYNPELSGGGALLDMAVHALDLAQWYIGPITSISAKVATLRKDIRVDDNVVAWITFNSNCLGYIDCGWTSPAGFVGVEIMGANGSINVDYGNSTVTMHSGECSPDGKNEIRRTVLKDSYTLQPWPTQMAYFTKGLPSEKNFTPGLEHGIDTLRLVLAAYESSSSGKCVKIEREKV